ncbi:MAG: hypothetical protein WDO19_29260 [Bacteroidota bacterium]
MKKFELLLKNEKIRSYDRIAILIILINLALFILLAINSADKKIRITSLTGAVLLSILLFAQYFSTRAKNKNQIPYRLTALYTAVVIWIVIEYWWISVTCFFLSLLYQVSKKPLLIDFSNEKIEYSSFPKRKVLWNQLTNVILKDGILTIDFKNNRILQAEISNTGPEVIEKEFNDFCRQQLKAAKQ